MRKEIVCGQGGKGERKCELGQGESHSIIFPVVFLHPFVFLEEAWNESVLSNLLAFGGGRSGERVALKKNGNRRQGKDIDNTDVLLSKLCLASRHDGQLAEFQGGFIVEPLMRAQLLVGRFGLQSEGQPVSF